MSNSKISKEQNKFIKDYAYQIFQSLELCTKSFGLNNFSFIKVFIVKKKNKFKIFFSFLILKHKTILAFQLTLLMKKFFY